MRHLGKRGRVGELKWKRKMPARLHGEEWGSVAYGEKNGCVRERKTNTHLARDGARNRGAHLPREVVRPIPFKRLAERDHVTEEDLGGGEGGGG